MTRVLLAMDGSDLARRAAARALEMLGPVEATVVTVARVPVSATTGGPLFAGDLPAPLQAEEIEGLLESAEDQARNEVAALGVDAEVAAVAGEPGPELCRLAAERKFELIVVGSHGAGFVRRVLMGSVSGYVLHHAPCPVL